MRDYLTCFNPFFKNHNEKIIIYTIILLIIPGLSLLRFPTSLPYEERKEKLLFSDLTMAKHGGSILLKLLRTLFKKFYKKALMLTVLNIFFRFCHVLPKYITVKDNPQLIEPHTPRNWSGGTLKPIELIGINSRFALIHKKGTRTKMVEKLNNLTETSGSFLFLCLL